MNDRLGILLEKKRIKLVKKNVVGYLCDIGCGNNKLVKEYKNGKGVDVFPWEGVDIIVKNSGILPFKNSEFDTVSIIAALNHIPNREEVLKEAFRITKPNGRLLITMIPPLISTIWHILRSPWDVDQSKRGMVEGEVYGLRKKEIIELSKKAGFEICEFSRFMLKINMFFVFKKVK